MSSTSVDLAASQPELSFTLLPISAIVKVKGKTKRMNEKNGKEDQGDSWKLENGNWVY